MIKDIMLHLDGSPEDETRLKYGQAIASAGRAHLIGIFTNLLPELTVATPMDGGAAVMQVLVELEERARRDGDATAQRLTERLASLQAPSELRRIDAIYGALSARATEQARCADLFIATRPYGETDTPVWSDLVEEVLFGSGRALLLVPPGRRWQGPIRTVLIAWNGSREAARALREGLIFVEQAERTFVLLVDSEPGAKPWLNVESHLTRHGVTPEIVIGKGEGRRVADIILEEANIRSADLIVMGGYGHTRLRERIFGGATADILAESDRPILIAH
jgi:nucleotide-binding universal stress UspA family protein